MIVRRFGSSVGSVVPAFNALALTEIVFARAPGLSMPATEFFESYERVGEKELRAETEGDVQLTAEEQLLDRLRAELEAAEAALGPGEVLLIESEPGRDYPKTREHTDTLVVEGENRLYFHWRVDPPLRVGIFRPRGAAGDVGADGADAV
ncbi:MAG TPA: hypothetical protein VFQ38_13480 [Longimicrobiales bacterium]|nr:hypothetical protein [Longimicrobiales bacterium]